MKRWSIPLIVVPLVLVGCAVGGETPDSDDRTEDTAETKSELRVLPALDSSKYCLPGEVVRCTLGPPPVCSCVPQPTTTTTTAVLSAY